MRRILIALLAALAISSCAPVWAQGYAELEAEQSTLDSRLTELHHEMLAARAEGDQEKLKDLEKELDTVQKRRAEALRALGQLPQ